MRDVTPWRALAVWLIGSLTWLGLAAPDLERRVSGSQLGPWRDAQLALLAPFVGARTLVGTSVGAAAWRQARSLFAGDGSAAAASPPAEGPRETGSRPPGPGVGAPERDSADPGESSGSRGLRERREAADSTPTTSPTATPSPSARRMPSADAPLRVLVVGDSIATDLGWALQNADAPLAVTVDTRPASGLARPDYFDWQAQLTLDLERDRPELVVVMLGGNDAQGFLVDQRPVTFGTEEWRATYASRVRALMELARRGGRGVLWVGLPVMRDAFFSDEIRALDETYAAEATATGTRYVDAWPLFADAQGRYAAYLPDAGGVLRAMRQPDGIHLSMDGARRLAARVLGTIASEWGSD